MPFSWAQSKSTKEYPLHPLSRSEYVLISSSPIRIVDDKIGIPYIAALEILRVSGAPSSSAGSLTCFLIAVLRRFSTGLSAGFSAGPLTGFSAGSLVGPRTGLLVDILAGPLIQVVVEWDNSAQPPNAWKRLNPGVRRFPTEAG
ncbi:MAG: hypothetical protein FE78DRAFT_532072 [Acidomyces sp. 'richmondensis']|nr:MAG: hypothetical protein FE78DRAFT_532072 [Acidomyces sp. 'richmondensis']